MSEKTNDTLIRALKGRPVEHTPVWLMRQAGRFLPEYRALREKAGSFMKLAKTPELACEATLQPVRRLKVDAAILFSDILTVPDAMGLGLSFVPGRGPVFEKTVRSLEDVRALREPDLSGDLSYVPEAAALCARELSGRVPLIGFCGSPFTLACYMVEGGSSPDFTLAKKMMYEAPEVFAELLKKLSASLVPYLLAQIRAGASAVQIFDTWGGMLAWREYRDFSLKAVEDVIQGVKKEAPDVPVIVFTKAGSGFLPLLAQSGADAVGLDWSVPLKLARGTLGGKALQGNMDPAILLTNEGVIRRGARRVIEDFGDPLQGGFVFNLGHGVDKRSDPALVEALVDEVHHFSKSA